MTFTIIIPFYKTQEYVKETLDSIKNQKKYDLKDVQVLFINDGDENFDLSILAAYKDSIPNIDYYKKHNTNWGGVINYVIKNGLIKGTYVTILDSDDTWSSQCLFSISQGLTSQADMIVGDTIFKNINTHSSKKYHTYFLSSGLHAISDKNRFLFCTLLHLPLCKFYKTSLFNKTVLLKEGVSYKDVEVYHDNLLRAKNVYYVKKVLGTYRENRPGNSIMMEWSKEKVDMIIDEIKYLDGIGLSSKAIFLLSYHKNNFIVNYKKYYQEPMILHSKLSLVFFPKSLKFVYKIALNKRIKQYKDIVRASN